MSPAPLAAANTDPIFSIILDPAKQSSLPEQDVEALTMLRPWIIPDTAGR